MLTAGAYLGGEGHWAMTLPLLVWKYKNLNSSENCIFNIFVILGVIAQAVTNPELTTEINQNHEYFPIILEQFFINLNKNGHQKV